jgi:hypothetical protein
MIPLTHSYKIAHCPVLVHVNGLVSGYGDNSSHISEMTRPYKCFSTKDIFFSFKTFMLTHTNKRNHESMSK